MNFDNKTITVAIDGYSSSGKSTMAKRLAAKVGYKYVDTGAMYRAITHAALLAGLPVGGDHLDINTADAVSKIAKNSTIDFMVMPDGTQHTLLNGKDVEREIRDLKVSQAVSSVAAVPEVREILVRHQQAMGRGGRVIMDGRDIGTTVFPHAELKIFAGASPETRAMRRYKELNDKGSQVSYDEVLENVKERDRIDTTRNVSPLRKADDAIVLDNSDMTLEEQDQWLLDRFNQALAGK